MPSPNPEPKEADAVHCEPAGSLQYSPIGTSSITQFLSRWYRATFYRCKTRTFASCLQQVIFKGAFRKIKRLMKEDRERILRMKDMKPVLKLRVCFEALRRVKRRREFEERTREGIGLLRDGNSIRRGWGLWRERFRAVVREREMVERSRGYYESSRMVEVC